MPTIRSEASRRREAARHGIPYDQSNALGPVPDKILRLDESVSILRVQYLTGDHRRRLASSGRALIVWRASIEQPTHSTPQAHFHESEHGSASGPKSAILRILGARNRSIVISFENDSVKDRALAHIQAARFDFIDERNVKLGVMQLGEGTAGDTSFVLGSGPLRSLGRLNDALRPFFTNLGHVLTKDIVGYPPHFPTIIKVVVYHSACPEWLQKSTVTRDGPRDQQLEVQRAATCTFCGQNGSADPFGSRGTSKPLRRKLSSQNDGDGLRKAPNTSVRERAVTPPHTEMVPDNGNAPQRNRYQNRQVAALRAPFRAGRDFKGGKVSLEAAEAQDPAHPARSAPAVQPLPRASNSCTDVNAANRKVKSKTLTVCVEYVLTSLIAASQSGRIQSLQAAGEAGMTTRDSWPAPKDGSCYAKMFWFHCSSIARDRSAVVKL